MVQSPQDPSGGSEQPLSQDDIDAALNEAGLEKPVSAPPPPAQPAVAAPTNAAQTPGTSAESAKPPPDPAVSRSRCRCGCRDRTGGPVRAGPSTRSQLRDGRGDCLGNQVGGDCGGPARRSSPDDGTDSRWTCPTSPGATARGQDCSNWTSSRCLRTCSCMCGSNWGRTRMLVQDVLRLGPGQRRRAQQAGRATRSMCMSTSDWWLAAKCLC